MVESAAISMPGPVAGDSTKAQVKTNMLTDVFNLYRGYWGRKCVQGVCST